MRFFIENPREFAQFLNKWNFIKAYYLNKGFLIKITFKTRINSRFLWN